MVDTLEKAASGIAGGFSDAPKYDTSAAGENSFNLIFGLEKILIKMKKKIIKFLDFLSIYSYNIK